MSRAVMIDTGCGLASAGEIMDVLWMFIGCISCFMFFVMCAWFLYIGIEE